MKSCVHTNNIMQNLNDFVQNLNDFVQNPNDFVQNLNDFVQNLNDLDNIFFLNDNLNNNYLLFCQTHQFITLTHTLIIQLL